MQVHKQLDTRPTCQNCRPVLVVDETCLLRSLDLARTIASIGPREPAVQTHASSSSITYKIPCSRFEVAWLSLPFESLAPVTHTAGSSILFCNHFLHRLVFKVSTSIQFLLLQTPKSPVVVVFLLVCIASWIWRVAVIEAQTTTSIANNLHSTTLHHQTLSSLSTIFVQLFVTSIHSSILVIAARLTSP
jgi:hypothetical protein